ncbi:MAG: ribose-5-phosphate isomerase, partial [Thermotogae bacterium]
MKIAIASDHAGYSLKQDLIAYLKELGHEVIDLGTNSEDSVDYP